MSVEPVEGFSEESFFPVLSQRIATWNGREISIEDLFSIKERMEERLLELLFSQSPSDFLRMAEQLAWVGTEPWNREAVWIFPTADGFVVKGQGYCLVKKGWLSRFFKEHKTEIIIGLAATAILATIIVATVYTGGAGAAAAAAAGGEVLDELQNGSSKDKKEDPPKQAEAPPPTEAQAPPALPEGETATEPEEPVLPKPPSPEKSSVWEQLGIPLTYPPSDLKLEPLPPDWKSPPIPSKPYFFFDPDAKPSPNPLRIGEGSKVFQIPGTFSFPVHLRIGGSNGIGNSPEQAKAHAEWLSKISGGNGIEWVYNSTHSAVVDAAEAFFVNYRGVSAPAAHLKENWERFHKDNEQNSGAKYLQYCHSQGAIHVKNALLESPQDIRDRVIVVAIAPAAVISKSLCHDSYNYASKRDFVFLGEITSDVLSNPVKAVEDFENLKELILLEPHPDAPRFDHGFDSPTFKGVIKKHIDDYVSEKIE